MSFAVSVYRPLSIVAICAIALMAASTAQARPGTPNEVTSTSPAPGKITISWQNTADERGVVFDIEGQNDPSVNNWAPPGSVRMHSKLSYTLGPLTEGNHCYRVWARVGVQGERSELPSAYTCSYVKSLGAPPHARPVH